MSAPKHTAHYGIPIHFRGGIADVQQRTGTTYADIGWHFGLHMRELVEPFGYAAAERKLDRLEAYINAGNFDKALKWFDKEFPRCMALVPKRRRMSFIKGIDLAFEQERVW